MENVLESIGVTKNYAGKAAVENVSLKLETGLVYAMLGPNGSGKTTWMKMVAGLVKPGKGEILYKSFMRATRWEKRARKRLPICPRSHIFIAG